MNYTSGLRAADTTREEGATDKETAENDTADRSRELTAELFVRSLAPAGARPQQTTVLERLDQLAHANHLNTYTVTIWGTGICLDTAVIETEVGRTILETVEEFRQWADRKNLVFRAGFKERTVSSMVTEEETMVIELPAMCLALREADDLRCVAPCSNNNASMRYSITDCLDELAGKAKLPVHDWPPISYSAD